MARSKKSFKSELHLGLLVIIIILMLLNVVSNYIIYKAKNAKINSENIKLNNAGLALSRNLSGRLPAQIDDVYIQSVIENYHLSGAIIIPSLPEDDNEFTKRNWFQGVVGQLSASQIDEVASKILTSDFKSVSRGERSEFFYLYPFKSKAGRALLILSRDNPELAFLEDASKVIFNISIFVIIAIIAVYSWLYKSILAPFRKIKNEAISAGRIVDNQDEVETTIEEYHRIISDLKEKEAELLILNDAITRKANSFESYNKYLLRSMISGLISLDNDGKIMSINRSAETMFGIAEQQLKGARISDLAFVSEQLLDRICHSIDNKESIRYREYELNHNSSIRYVGVSISAVTDEATNNLGVSILINDVTELKRLRQELERSHRLAALGEMAAGLAHQIRNSLGAVLGYGNLIKKKLKKQVLETNAVDSLMTETREAEKLIGKFLNITKPLEYHPEPIQLKLLFDEMIANWKVQPKYKKIRFSCKFDTGFEACFDPLLIKQVFNNLIDNSATAYGDVGGDIELSYQVVHDEVVFIVDDMAGGIPKENLEKIFTPFYSTRASGTGLGLPLVKKIIELHQGIISVEQIGESGSRFKINLPISPKSESVLAI